MSTAVVCAISSLSCGSSSSPSPNPNAPGALDPTASEWRGLAAQLAGVAVDGVQRAVDSTSTGSLLIAALAAPRRSLDTTIPLTRLSWQNSYYCCGSNPTERATVAGRIDVTVDGAGITVTESIQSATDLTWGPSDRSHKLRLPSDGLKVTSNLVTLGDGVAPVQELRLQGTVRYYVTGPDGQNVEKTAEIDLRLGYKNFPSSGEGPELNGTIGPEKLDRAMGSAERPVATEEPIIVSTHTGSFVLPLRVTIQSGFSGPPPIRIKTCVESSALSAVVKATLRHLGRGAVGGSADIIGSDTLTATCSLVPAGSTAPLNWDPAITGTTTALGFSGQTSRVGGGVTVTNQIGFSGNLSGGTVNGRLSFSRTRNSANEKGSGSASAALTLR
jgi:hypothetical protein